MTVHMEWVKLRPPCVHSLQIATRSGRQELPTDRDISHMKALLQQLVVTGDTNKIGSLVLEVIYR